MTTMTMRAVFLFVLVALSGILAFSDFPAELFDYVESCRGRASWELVKKPEAGGRIWEIRVNSQIWRGIPWTHRLLVVEPAVPVVENVILLYVSGDPSLGEELLGQTVANLAGLRVAILNSVPNQPLFGLREDDLIAYTFSRYLEEGSPDWPLLFPMVQSVVSAMDALSALSSELWGTKLRGFIVAGASKRGWTTYLTAAVDSRVLGMIPIVFDFLNIPAQLARQEETLGGPSSKLEDYAARGLTALADPAPQAVRLAYLVDPYTYRYAYTMPKLVVVGANDPYWATDATSLYWPALPAPKLLYVVPNAGHNVLFGDGVLPTIAAFAKLVARGSALPKLESSLRFLKDEVEIEIRTDWPVKSARLWLASSSAPDLDKAHWQYQELLGETGWYRAEIRRSSAYLGFFAEVVFNVEGLELRVSTPIRVMGP